jgi:hypothetical protein
MLQESKINSRFLSSYTAVANRVLFQVVILNDHYQYSRDYMRMRNSNLTSLILKEPNLTNTKQRNDFQSDDNPAHFITTM